MSDNIHLTPEYLDIDFLTMKDRLINLLKNTDTFKDYNFEGANITLLLELVSYLGDLTNFYLNEVAKNVYPDTSNLYETTHSLVSQRGYLPNGYVSATVDTKMTIKRYDENNFEYYKPGDQIYIPAWYSISTEQTNNNGEMIYYSTTLAQTETIPASAGDEYSFIIPMKQGKPFTVTYSGQDIIDGSVILPFKNIDMGIFPFNENFPSMMVYVNEEPWIRVNDFYDILSGLKIDNNVYKLVYDKYKRYSIQFSTARNMPDNKSRIRAVFLESFGSDGNLGANIINKDYGGFTIAKENVPFLIDRNWIIKDTPFVKNLTKNLELLKDQIKLVNESASINGLNPETITEIKINSKKFANTQKRNVTKLDYISDLETRTDIIKANVWGEQETGSLSVYDYNRIYISVIPLNWAEHTIPAIYRNWIDPLVPDINQDILVPQEFNPLFKNELKRYIEPKKIISTYESFVPPDIVYFKFEIGILPKRMYNFNNIVHDVRSKLVYYFDPTNREFNETIDFRDIHNFIIDPGIKSPSDKFDNVRGIQNFVFRDIALYSTLSNQNDPMEIFNLNENNQYPMFTVSEMDIRYDNLLKPIKLGLSQFPMIAIDMCIFINEA